MTSTLDFPAVAPRRQVRHHLTATRLRIKDGVRHPANWLQLLRFGFVGATGYVVNLAVYAACVHAVGIDFRLASVVAFLVGVANNFWLNRHWTFGARQDHPARQAIKFFVVALLAYGVSYAVLVSLVNGAGMDKVIAQAIAVIAGMPLSFAGQKLWTFKA